VVCPCNADQGWRWFHHLLQFFEKHSYLLYSTIWLEGTRHLYSNMPQKARTEKQISSAHSPERRHRGMEAKTDIVTRLKEDTYL
jgi:hypothetical protein